MKHNKPPEPPKSFRDALRLAFNNRVVDARNKLREAGDDWRSVSLSHLTPDEREFALKTKHLPDDVDLVAYCAGWLRTRQRFSMPRLRGYVGDQHHTAGADDGAGWQRFDEGTASRHLVPGAIDGRTMGREVHRLIADLVSVGVREPTPRQLRAQVAGHPLVSDPRITYRQAAKQRLLVATALYFRFFVPLAPWCLLGSEVTVGSSRLDLVWRNGEEVIADEIKSGRIVDRFEHDQLERQIDRALANANDRYGDAFTGLRVLLLAAPSKSFVLRSDGKREPFVWGDDA